MGRVALLVHFEPKTKSVRRAFVFLTSTAVLLIPSLIGAEVLDVHALARAVDEHYNRLRTLQAEFTEIYRGSGIGRTESTRSCSRLLRLTRLPGSPSKR